LWLVQGGHDVRDRNWQEPPFNAASVNAVSLRMRNRPYGYLPRFVNHGFRGPIYCSAGTADLMKILLPDSARLQEEEADISEPAQDNQAPAGPARSTLKKMRVKR